MSRRIKRDSPAQPALTTLSVKQATRRSAQMPDKLPYILPEQLCIGLYVHLELSWWEHDFAFNQFKISSEAQLQALQALRLPRLRYDPARSDAQPLAIVCTNQNQPAQQDTFDPDAELRQARTEQLKQLRSRLAEVDKRFSENSQRIKNLNQTLRSRPEDAIREADIIIKDMVSTLLQTPSVVLHSITGKAAENNYTHPLNVTVLSLLLGRQLGLNSEACNSLGMGALLHDIGKLEVPSKVLLKSSPLTKPEQQLRQLHTEFGLRMGQKLMLDDEVLRIIHEHHEYCDGSGYPRQLREVEIGRLSRLVAITNHFDDLCNPLDSQQALSPTEALSLMFSQQRERFDEVGLKAFIRCMGVYPPGSLVQLNDERYGLVLGMDSEHMLKPSLIVYQADTPKEQALIINLENEPKLSIARSVRAAQLPREVLEYLNPRHNLSYYIEPQKPLA